MASTEGRSSRQQLSAFARGRRTGSAERNYSSKSAEVEADRTRPYPYRPSVITSSRGAAAAEEEEEGGIRERATESDIVDALASIQNLDLRRDLLELRRRKAAAAAVQKRLGSRGGGGGGAASGYGTASASGNYPSEEETGGARSSNPSSQYGYEEPEPGEEEEYEENEQGAEEEELVRPRGGRAPSYDPVPIGRRTQNGLIPLRSSTAAALFEPAARPMTLTSAVLPPPPPPLPPSPAKRPPVIYSDSPFHPATISGDRGGRRYGAIVRVPEYETNMDVVRRPLAVNSSPVVGTAVLECGPEECTGVEYTNTGEPPRRVELKRVIPESLTALLNTPRDDWLPDIILPDLATSRRLIAHHVNDMYSTNDLLCRLSRMRDRTSDRTWLNLSEHDLRNLVAEELIRQATEWDDSQQRMLMKAIGDLRARLSERSVLLPLPMKICLIKSDNMREEFISWQGKPSECHMYRLRALQARSSGQMAVVVIGWTPLWEFARAEHARVGPISALGVGVSSLEDFVQDQLLRQLIMQFTQVALQESPVLYYQCLRIVESFWVPLESQDIINAKEYRRYATSTSAASSLVVLPSGSVTTIASLTKPGASPAEASASSAVYSTPVPGHTESLAANLEPDIPTNTPLIPQINIVINDTEITYRQMKQPESPSLFTFIRLPARPPPPSSTGITPLVTGTEEFMLMSLASEPFIDGFSTSVGTVFGTAANSSALYLLQAKTEDNQIAIPRRQLLSVETQQIPQPSLTPAGSGVIQSIAVTVVPTDIKFYTYTRPQLYLVAFVRGKATPTQDVVVVPNGAEVIPLLDNSDVKRQDARLKNYNGYDPVAPIVYTMVKALTDTDFANGIGTGMPPGGPVLDVWAVYADRMLRLLRQTWASKRQTATVQARGGIVQSIPMFDPCPPNMQRQYALSQEQFLQSQQQQALYSGQPHYIYGTSSGTSGAQGPAPLSVMAVGPGGVPTLVTAPSTTAGAPAPPAKRGRRPRVPKAR